jgi:hypothetical protein
MELLATPSLPDPSMLPDGRLNYGGSRHPFQPPGTGNGHGYDSTNQGVVRLSSVGRKGEGEPVFVLSSGQRR